MWIQGQRWRGSWGPSRIACEDTSWGRESSASTNIPPTSSLTWLVPPMIFLFLLMSSHSANSRFWVAVYPPPLSAELVVTVLLQEKVELLYSIIVRTNLKNAPALWAFLDCVMAKQYHLNKSERGSNSLKIWGWKRKKCMKVQELEERFTEVSHYRLFFHFKLKTKLILSMKTGDFYCVNFLDCYWKTFMETGPQWI